MISEKVLRLSNSFTGELCTLDLADRICRALGDLNDEEKLQFLVVMQFIFSPPHNMIEEIEEALEKL